MNAPTIVLREYQQDMVDSAVNFFKSKKPVPSIIVAPTAAGKSIVIAKIAKELNEKILVVQPSKELLEQNYNKFINLGGTASIYSASFGEKEIGLVTYATIGSIVTVAHRFKELGISKIIIDECDRFPREPNGMLRRFLKASKISHILGLTATPLKLHTSLSEDKCTTVSKLLMLTDKAKSGNFFKNIISIVQISDMVNGNYWSRLEYQSYDFNSGELVFNTTGADYTDDSIRKAYKSQRIEDKIVKKVSELYSRKAILIAVPSISEAISLANRIPSCEAVYSDMPREDRIRIIDEFKTQKLRCIVQVNILSVGFDYPELDTIITGRPTASLSWWYQFVGRVTRIHPKKDEGLIIDFVGSVTKFGRVEELYFKKLGDVWQLYGQGKRLLTGIPMGEIGLHIEGKPSPYDLAKSAPAVKMPYGKFAGRDIKDIPKNYRDWLLNDLTPTAFNKHIIDELIRLNKIGI